jgi:hypothetical protein
MYLASAPQSLGVGTDSPWNKGTANPLLALQGDDAFSMKKAYLCSGT